jgi:hypothetical protein
MLNKMVTFNNAGRVHLDSQPADLETAVRYFQFGIRDGTAIVHVHPQFHQVHSSLMSLHDGMGLVAMRRYMSLRGSIDPDQAEKQYMAATMEFSKAIEHGERAIKAGNRQEETARVLAETYARRATMRELGKDLNAAIDDWRVAISRLNPSHASHSQCLVGYAVTLARSGDHRLAAQALSSIPVDSRSVDNAAFNVACAYSMMRSAAMSPMPTPTQPMESLRLTYLAKAMEWLERANVVGTFSSSETVDQLLADIDLDGIRETPEFRAFAERMLRDSRRAIHDQADPR